MAPPTEQSHSKANTLNRTNRVAYQKQPFPQQELATPFEPYSGKQSELDCTEEGPDGFLDLTLKFDIQKLVAALGPVNDGDIMVLVLTGNLKEEYGAIPIVGEDVVRIIKKGGKK